MSGNNFNVGELKPKVVDWGSPIEPTEFLLFMHHHTDNCKVELLTKIVNKGFEQYVILVTLSEEEQFVYTVNAQGYKLPRVLGEDTPPLVKNKKQEPVKIVIPFTWATHENDQKGRIIKLPTKTEWSYYGGIHYCMSDEIHTHKLTLTVDGDGVFSILSIT